MATGTLSPDERARAERRRVGRRAGRVTRRGGRPTIAEARSRSSRSRRAVASPSWLPSGTAASGTPGWTPTRSSGAGAPRRTARRPRWCAAPPKGAGQGQHAGAGRAHLQGRRRAAHRQRRSARGPDRRVGRAGRRTRRQRGDRSRAPVVPPHAVRRCAPCARPVPTRRRRTQGRRRRKCRHAGAHRAAARAGCVGSALPPGQGGRALGPRAPCRDQPLRAPRPPRGRGAVADAGGERHLPGLGHGPRGSTASAGTSTFAGSGTGSARPRSS
jgi:hypothetical protein